MERERTLLIGAEGVGLKEEREALSMAVIHLILLLFSHPVVSNSFFFNNFFPFIFISWRLITLPDQKDTRAPQCSSQHCLS